MFNSAILAIDAGNSFVKIGLFDGENLVRSERLESDPTLGSDEWSERFRQFFQIYCVPAELLEGVVVTSVTPNSTGSIIEALEKVQKSSVLEVKADHYPFRILYDDPKKVGADRLCDAIAGRERAHGPAIVVDFGTAVTLNAVSEEGDFLGGVIVPGPNLAAAALASGTANLPKVQPVFPAKVIGTATEENLAAGLTFGWTALVDGLLFKMETEMGGMVNVFATGGAGLEYSKHSRRIEAYHPNLTLEGAVSIFRSWKARH